MFVIHKEKQKSNECTLIKYGYLNAKGNYRTNYFLFSKKHFLF